jgi:protein-S-isoprenylcysteine O-methyltransferase Ste14
MKRGARILKKAIVVLVVGVLVLGIGTSSVALWFKVVTIVLLSVAGIGLLIGCDDDEGDDHIVFG